MSLAFTPMQPRTRPSSACVSCGGIPGATVQFDEFTLAKLRARHAVANGTEGGAVGILLPPLASIVPRAMHRVLSTDAAGRIEPDIDVVRINPHLRDELFRRLCTQMRLTLAKPRGVKATALGHKVILHIGLAHKFVDDQHLDASHIRFARYMAQVLDVPIEVWRDRDGEDPQGMREVYRVIGALAVSRSDIHFMHVVVECDTHIVRTAYAIGARQVEAYRCGVPVALPWAER